MMARRRHPKSELREPAAGIFARGSIVDCQRGDFEKFTQVGVVDVVDGLRLKYNAPYIIILP
jgi:hypothetical protein